MREIKLSVLIPITPERYKIVSPLVELVIGESFPLPNPSDTHWTKRLISKIHPEVEMVIISDEKELTLGEKREKLYQEAEGTYSIQVDSDDMLSQSAIPLILAATETNPDCITFQERVTLDGKRYKSNFSNTYSDWEGSGNKLLSDGFHFQRTVFYKSVIKTEIARSVPFKKIRYGEDHAWARDLKRHLKTEIHINDELYYYNYESTPKDKDRYGHDRE